MEKRQFVEEPESFDSSKDTPIGGGDLSKMKTPYYSYHVDKAIKSVDSHYWARRSSHKAPIIPPEKSQREHLFSSDFCDVKSLMVPEEVFDQQVASELEDLYTRFHKCLELRDKYMELSLQRLGDNPKDHDTWNIYPPPPQPTWKSLSNNRSFSDDSVSSSYYKNEKKGVGENFEFDKCEIPGEHEYNFKLNESGIYNVYETQEDLDNNRSAYEVPSVKDYFMDLECILETISDGPAKSYAYKRLCYLESKWNMYSLLREYQEIADSKSVPHRDFYNVRKVDTHVHLSSCMNSKHLLRFIKSKLKKFPKDEVIFRDNKVLTLEQVFKSLKLSAYELSIDTLDMHAHTDSFHRFDKFNLKYNPIGESRLREIFLKTNNYINGRYFAELTKGNYYFDL
ncbi:1775_t:CDS:2 [Funneliformis caledonium]|uniref:AMP deaminase n=1 Tax=Funneliformis caledonium TaxID=1117310 RepID=A0A9N9AWN6_9GLOM|nr:1775_t:CDS:2 [Funneliformis caledonium]